jgi:hypothetical protein
MTGFDVLCEWWVSPCNPAEKGSSCARACNGNDRDQSLARGIAPGARLGYIGGFRSELRAVNR